MRREPGHGRTSLDAMEARIMSKIENWAWVIIICVIIF